MTIHYHSDDVLVWHGDSLDLMRELPDGCMDAVVTDPPYGLGFMGAKWDTYANETGRRKSVRHKFDHVGGNHNPKDSADQARTRRVEDHRFQAWCEEWAAECLRILKPGGHLLAFGGTRTFHRLTAGIEDAGFEIRDSIAWLYGSGFPKSLDVGKAIDKLDATDERATRARTFQAWLREHLTPQEVNTLTGTDMGHHLTTHPTQPAVATADMFDRLRPRLPEVPEHIEQLVAARTVESRNFKAREVVGPGGRSGQARNAMAGDFAGAWETTAAATADAARWNGWGTALKPAFEPIVVARKPLHGTVAANVLAYGTGALNIDGSRIPTDDFKGMTSESFAGTKSGDNSWNRDDGGIFDAGRRGGWLNGPPAGRWPANVVLDESQAAALDAQSGTSTSPTGIVKQGGRKSVGGILNAVGAERNGEGVGYGDKGGASRFFYVAKAPRRERPKLEGSDHHPTVKPLTLMRHLVKLVTPPGGTVLDPFAGSGTTAEACLLEGFRCMVMEREADYLPLIVHRIERAGQTV